MKLLIACLLINGLNACATSGQGIECGAYNAILITKAEVDKLSPESIRQILTHNELGAKLGCW